MLITLGVPVVVLAAVTAAMEAFPPGPLGLSLLLLFGGAAFVAFCVMLWCLPLAIASIAEGDRSPRRIVQKAFTKRYVYTMVGVALLWLVVMAVLTVITALLGFTLMIPVLAMGLGIYTAYVGMGVLMAWFFEPEPKVTQYRKRKGASVEALDYELKEMRRAIDRLKVSRS